MELNELAFYERLKEIRDSIQAKTNRIMLPRAPLIAENLPDRIKEYQECVLSVYEETRKLDELLELAQPSSMETALSVFLAAFHDEIQDILRGAERYFNKPPSCPPYIPVVGKPLHKGEPAEGEQSKPPES